MIGAAFQDINDVLKQLDSWYSLIETGWPSVAP
jgi:hypothetical protein